MGCGCCSPQQAAPEKPSSNLPVVTWMETPSPHTFKAELHTTGDRDRLDTEVRSRDPPQPSITGISSQEGQPGDPFARARACS